jgi:hypothetical protein
MSDTLDLGWIAPENKPFITGDWPHIFEGARRDTICRILIDADKEILLLADIEDSTGFRASSRSEFEDLMDSLKHANPEAFDNPEDFGLVRTEKMPEWALRKAS